MQTSASTWKTRPPIQMLASVDAIYPDKELDVNKKVLEKNFAMVHVGYDEGIDVQGLDSTSNWQFGH